MSVAPEVTQGLRLDQLQDELLELMQYRVWEKSLYTFSRECLGLREETHPDLAGFEDPMVQWYVDRVGTFFIDWLENRYWQPTTKWGMLLTPRKCYKTTIGRALATWLNVMHDPEISILYGCAKMKGEGTTVARVMESIKAHFEGEQPNSRLIEVFGDLRGDLQGPNGGRKRKWSTEGLVTQFRKNTGRQDPTIGGFSVETGATGGHPDVAIMDDLVPGYEYCYESWFESCRKTHNAMPPILGKSGLGFYIATMYEEGDHITWIRDTQIAPLVRKHFKGELPPDFRQNFHLYAHLVGWFVLRLNGYEGDLYDEKNCKVWFPKVWSREAMIAYKESAPADFAAQIQNDPQEREDWPITPEVIERLWIEPGDVPPEVWNNVLMPMDLAWKRYENFVKAKGDRSAILSLGIDYAGNLYYLPQGQFVGKVMKDQFKTAWVGCVQSIYKRRGRIRQMTWDENPGGELGATFELFGTWAVENCPPCPPRHQLKRSGSRDRKDDRIMGMLPYVVEGRLRLVKGAPYVNELVDELLRRTRYKDMIDCLTDAFNSDFYRPGKRLPGVDRVGPPAPQWRGLRGRPQRLSVVAGGGFPSGQNVNPTAPIRTWGRR